MTSVLVCDDHRIVREGLSQFIRDVPGVEQVETAASGEEVLARFARERPDLVLMDVRMPGLGGLAATRRLTSAHPSAVVLMISAETRRDQMTAAVSAGARGYLSKNVGLEELREAVAAALAGRDLVEPSLRRALVESAPALTPAASELSEREVDVLRGMSQGKSNAHIGRELYIAEDTVKTHARRLFRKLDVSDRAEAVAVGFRRGLVQ
jgi:DNA-binding NarL/FixJ family response regulator